MKVVESSIVSMNYVLKNDEGEVLDQSGGDPIEFLQGAGNIIPGLDAEIIGMAVGDAKNVTVQPADAYGDYSEKLIQTMPLDMFNGVEKVEPGMQFHAQGPEGPFTITVKEVVEEGVIVDGNHDLAGQVLHFEIEITEIREATEEELQHGHPHQEGGCCGGSGHDDSGCCGGEGHTDGSECCGGEGHDDGSACCSTEDQKDGSSCCS
ncbi:MAG: peptidylprolyl isomerase [Fibrobacterales bacterium]